MGRRPGPAARRRKQQGAGDAGVEAPADKEQGEGVASSGAASEEHAAPSGGSVLAGCTFALSTTGESQAPLSTLIAAHGGTVVKIVNSSVDYLVATAMAVRRNTQAVRKARDKFGVPMVTPAWIRTAIATGALGDPAAFAPRSEAAGGSTSYHDAGSPCGGAPLEALGLRPGSTIRVLVEMADDPTEQWWPATVHAPAPDARRPHAHALTYEPLPARGYGEATSSRALLEAARLFDLDEQVWRPWAAAAEAAEAAAATAAAGPLESATMAEAEAAAEDVVDVVGASSGRRRRRRCHGTRPPAVALLSLRGSTAYFLRLWAWERERRGKRGRGRPMTKKIR